MDCNSRREALLSADNRRGRSQPAIGTFSALSQRPCKKFERRSFALPVQPFFCLDSLPRRTQLTPTQRPPIRIPPAATRLEVLHRVLQRPRSRSLGVTSPGSMEAPASTRPCWTPSISPAPLPPTSITTIPSTTPSTTPTSAQRRPSARARSTSHSSLLAATFTTSTHAGGCYCNLERAPPAFRATTSPRCADNSISTPLSVTSARPTPAITGTYGTASTST